MSGAYYADEHVTLYHGDCREVTEWLDADVLVTDPPYGRKWRQGRIEGRGNGRIPSDASAAHIGIAGDLDTSIRDHALSLWAGPAVVFGDLMLPSPPNTRQVLIYRKPSSAGVRGATAGHRRDVEAIYLIGPWSSGIGGRSSVVDAGYANVATGPAAETGHPHAKSLAVMEHLVALTGGVVADPFAGSGSTLAAARAVGRPRHRRRDRGALLRDRRPSTRPGRPGLRPHPTPLTRQRAGRRPPNPGPLPHRPPVTAQTPPLTGSLRNQDRRVSQEPQSREENAPDEGKRYAMTQKCQRCDGCGQLADSEDREPWTAWTSLPQQSAIAIQLGWVKPIPCDACNGTGEVTA